MNIKQLVTFYNKVKTKYSNMPSDVFFQNVKDEFDAIGEKTFFIGETTIGIVSEIIIDGEQRHSFYINENDIFIIKSKLSSPDALEFVSSAMRLKYSHFVMLVLAGDTTIDTYVMVSLSKIVSKRERLKNLLISLQKDAKFDDPETLITISEKIGVAVHPRTVSVQPILLRPELLDKCHVDLGSLVGGRIIDCSPNDNPDYHLFLSGKFYSLDR